MATRSSIAIEEPNGNIYGIYCHWDGDSIGEILKKHYTNADIVRALIDQGDASAIRETIEKSVFYMRDKGESLAQTEPTHEPNFGSFMECYCAEYNYLFIDGEWRTFTEYEALQIKRGEATL
tara:strand:- start:864 stop:1229 length:366 start_codon:yes stop_codon:yes gene_type:complete